MKSDKSALRRWLSKKRHSKNKEKLTAKLLRLVYYRLIVPMKREKDQPHNIAYGVLIGLIIGFTPTVGFQMPLILIAWIIARKVFNFHFSIILAIAWSWLSNPATMIPLYFVYYQTGSLILNFGGEGGFTFSKFTELFKGADLDDIEGAVEFLSFLWDTIGLSIWVGCVPYAIILGLIGYYMSLAVVRNYQKMKEHRRQNKRK